MREILFRGKRADNGEWVFGDLRQYVNIVGCEDFYEIDTMSDTIGYGHSYKVILETVGQFTGLTDKNGRKIFEGDIVKIIDKIVGYERLAIIVFGNPNGVYSWGYQLKPISAEPFATDILHWVDMEESGAFIEVLGNIYDNPELLEASND